jgi:hypothetical protein
MFKEIQTDVSKCPTLFFFDEHAKITVETDASDYGIGAYIYES